MRSSLKQKLVLGQDSNLGHSGKSGLVPVIVTHCPGDLGHVVQGLSSKGGSAHGGDAVNPRCLVSAGHPTSAPPPAHSILSLLNSHLCNILSFVMCVWR